MDQAGCESPKLTMRARVWWIAVVVAFAITWLVMIWPHLANAREVSRIRLAIYSACAKHEGDDIQHRDNWRFIRDGLSPSDKPALVLEALWDLAVLQREPPTDEQLYCNDLCAQALHEVALRQAIPPGTSEFSKQEWHSSFDSLLKEKGARRQHLKEPERALLEKLGQFQSISSSS